MRAFVGAQLPSRKTGTSQVAVMLKQYEKYVENKVAERHRDHTVYRLCPKQDKPKIAVAVVGGKQWFERRLPCLRPPSTRHITRSENDPPHPQQVIRTTRVINRLWHYFSDQHRLAVTEGSDAAAIAG